MRVGMSVLASLLVRDQLISIDRVQEAIQEQVMRGGNLDTILLELGCLAENPMSAYCAAVYGLMPATRAEVMGSSLDAIRSVPREFAVRHRLIPLTRAEDAIVLAVDRPLPDAILREISFELGVDPVQRVASSVRIEAGLARHYDIEMTARMRKLTEALDRQDEGEVPYVTPFEGVGKRSSLPPRKKISGSYPRVESSIPAPVGIADTEPPPPSGSREASSVPAGTFRDSNPGRPRAQSHSGFVDATRYSLPPRPPEVLGRPAARSRRPPDAPNRSSRPAPASRAWEPAPPPAVDTEPPAEGRTRRPVPHDARRDNDGSAIAHDVVSLGPHTPSSAPPSADADPVRANWVPAPPPETAGSLPSVIVDFGDEVEGLIDALRDAGPEDEMVILPLLAQGETALPALAREFPGRLWFDRHEPYAKVPAGRDVSPVARTFVAFGQRSVSYLIPLLDHSDPDVRFYATLVASEFVHPDLVPAVGKRLYDSDSGVRAGAYRALSVLYACELEFDELVEKLRAAARDGRKLPVQVTSIEALGRLRDVDSFEFLVSLLDSPAVEVIRAAHASLVRLSCQDFGTAQKKWRAWYDKQLSRHRVEWLIDALTHTDERLRRRASDELKHLTQEYFGYHPGHAKREREAAQEKYRRWWHEVGSRMFRYDERPSSGHAGRQ
ncbi:MAG: HEAT repeat domain-containing protein [Myxococcota bacterium]